jgi:sialate O-acetylesterase
MNQLNPMKHLFVQLLFVLAALGVGPRSLAGVRLPALFSDHAVLLKDREVPVWGKASPGEKVTVILGAARGEATAGADGRWRTSLDLSQFDAKPRKLIVKGKNTVEINDVIVGEVWLASGQSNMEWVTYNVCDSKSIIASSANPELRVFTVRKRGASKPLDDCEGQWLAADPRTTGGFTAVGYLFARSLNKHLKQPVGLVHASWGGTPIETWTSTEALLSSPELAEPVRRMQEEAEVFPARLTACVETYAEWCRRLGRTDERKFEIASLGDARWKRVTFPAVFAEEGLPDSGAVWLRRTIEVPASLENIGQSLEIGDVAGLYEVYWNGDKVAESNERTGRRRLGPIFLKGEAVRPGKTVLTIRVFNPSGESALKATAQAPLRFSGRDLAGEWEVFVERELPPLALAVRASAPSIPLQPLGVSQLPAFLFNGMINPVIPYAVRGVIWYQGESNTGRAYQYRKSFPLMINDWRKRWGRGEIEFLWCQLANFGPKSASPDQTNGWAELREAQYRTLQLPHTGQAVLIEQGEELDVHPREKREAGMRLARIALACSYGKDISYSGPLLAGAALQGSSIKLKFAHIDGGLVARPLPATYKPRSTAPDIKPLSVNSPGSEVQGFVICGKDRKWVWASAKIEGDTVVVSSPEVRDPVAVRYAWGTNPTCNLFNGAGLPASPFRTDEFPLSTQDARF